MTLIKTEYGKADSIDHITVAAARDIKAGKSSGIDIRKHLMPVFNGIKKEVINDCKLSRLACGLVLMNADAQIPFVA